MINKNISLILKKSGNLPSLPPLVNKIMDVTNDEKSSVQDISDVISIDQAFAAKVLRLANSAYFGYAGKISTISQAIVILGTESIKNIALGISVFSSINGLSQNLYRRLTEIWKHSIKTAIVSKEIAKITRYQYPEEAFLAGLLHDFGWLVILKYISSNENILPIFQSQNQSSAETEKNFLAETHTELGASLADFWNLPKKLGAVMLYHHSPYEIPQDIADDPEINSIIKIVALSQASCNGDTLSLEESFLILQIQKETGITKEQLDELVSGTNAECAVYERVMQSY